MAKLGVSKGWVLCGELREESLHSSTSKRHPLSLTHDPFLKLYQPIPFIATSYKRLIKNLD